MADPPLDLLTRMTRLICHSVADGCGITVLFRGQPVTVAYSSELASLGDELQYTTDAGPCLQALESQTVVECHDLAEERRWGRYPAAAMGCGMRSILSLPIDAAGAGHGALNLYSRTAHGFDEQDLRRGLEFAQIMSGILAAARAVERSGAAEQWQRALQRRTAVAQAVGILMARHGCDRERAFALLMQCREDGEDLHAAATRIGAGLGRSD